MPNPSLTEGSEPIALAVGVPPARRTCCQLAGFPAAPRSKNVQLAANPRASLQARFGSEVLLRMGQALGQNLSQEFSQDFEHIRLLSFSQAFDATMVHEH